MTRIEYIRTPSNEFIMFTTNDIANGLIDVFKYYNDANKTFLFTIKDTDLVYIAQCFKGGIL